jgi:hypothetical protein
MAKAHQIWSHRVRDVFDTNKQVRSRRPLGFNLTFWYSQASTTPLALANISYEIRVARWHILNQKSQFWANFGGSCNGRCWYIWWPNGPIYGHLVYFVAILEYLMVIYVVYFVVIWYIFPLLVCCTKKNLATSYEYIYVYMYIFVWNEFSSSPRCKYIRITRFLCR